MLLEENTQEGVVFHLNICVLSVFLIPPEFHGGLSATKTFQFYSFLTYESDRLMEKLKHWTKNTFSCQDMTKV